MKREQAIRINNHLVIANEAMKQARTLIAELGSNEHLEFDGPLFEVQLELQWSVMLPLYDKFPDLMSTELLEGLPTVTLKSDLAWSDVTLPRRATEAALDELLMSLLKPHWQKLALVLLRGIERCEELGLPFNDRLMAARLRFLFDSGRIEGLGDLRFPGSSQVRLMG